MGRIRGHTNAGHMRCCGRRHARWKASYARPGRAGPPPWADARLPSACAGPACACARLCVDGGGGGRDALEGKGPQRRPQRRLGRPLEEVAEAVGGGYCRLQMPLKPPLGVREPLAGCRLGALEGGGVPPPLPMPSLGGGGGGHEVCLGGAENTAVGGGRVEEEGGGSHVRTPPTALRWSRRYVSGASPPPPPQHSDDGHAVYLRCCPAPHTSRWMTTHRDSYNDTLLLRMRLFVTSFLPSHMDCTNFHSVVTARQ